MTKNPLNDLLNLPTEKEIKTAVLDLIDQGVVTAIEADGGGIKYYPTIDINPAMLGSALSSKQVEMIRIRNQGKHAAGLQ